MTLPTAPLPTARVKATPEDFIVEEIPLYVPSGTGEHLYLHIEKRELTTADALTRVARALDVRRDGIGTAGLKDKIGITRQWLSVPIPPRTPDFETRAAALDVDGIRLLEAKRHENKLRTGHLFGNRFDLRLRDIDALQQASIEQAFAAIAKDGIPNAYGSQRFGRAGDNAERAKAWIMQGMPRLRDLRDAKFLVSALQSAIFNLVLERRQQAGTWNRALLGDVMQRERALPGEPEQRFAQFLCDDLAACESRVASFEISPTGPMPGVAMTQAAGEVRALEDACTLEVAGDGIDWQKVSRFGEGTRRTLRLAVRELQLEWLAPDPLRKPDHLRKSVAITSQLQQGAEGAEPLPFAESTDSGKQLTDMRVRFVLPKGAYATTVLGSVFSLLEPHVFRGFDTSNSNLNVTPAELPSSEV